jgi:ribosomal protein L37E
MAEAKRKIRAKEIVQDVRAGLTDLQIMSKHELSPKELERVLSQLVHLELISQLELDQRAGSGKAHQTPLITCPSCGREYPTAEGECPECGFSEISARPPAEKKPVGRPISSQSSGPGKVLFVISLIAIVVVVAAVTTYYFMKRKKEAEVAKVITPTHFLTLQEKAEAYAAQNELSGTVALSSLQDVEASLRKPDLDVDAPDIDDRTLLMVAAEYGRFDVVKLLLYYGANMYATDIRGNTPALIACKNGHVDIIDLLVDKGYDVDFRNLGGESVRSLAHQSGDKKLKDVVIKGTKLPKTERVAIYKMWRTKRHDALQETCKRLCSKRIDRRPCVETCMKYYDLGETDKRILE